MISIIIALYNGNDYIIDTIDSALNQTIEKEIIVIDDCSTDGAFENVKEKYKNNKCIQFFRNEINLGFCKTVNIGIKKSKGDYILVLGQDDILPKDHCEIVMEYMNKNVSMCFCDYNLIDENSEIYDTTEHCTHSNKTIKDLYKNNSIPSVGLIMNKKILNEVGGYPEDKSFPQYGEYHTWIRMALQGEICFCEKSKANYRRHKSNMTNDFNNYKTKVKLLKYYAKCKKQILISTKVSFKDKIFVFVYMVYYTFKELIKK